MLEEDAPAWLTGEEGVLVGEKLPLSGQGVTFGELYGESLKDGDSLDTAIGGGCGGRFDNKGFPVGFGGPYIVPGSRLPVGEGGAVVRGGSSYAYVVLEV